MKLMKFSRQRFVDHDYQSCINFAASFINTPNFFWAIVVNNKSLDHIGNITAVIDETNSVANLTIMIGDRNFSGKGLGIHAWSLALNFLLYKKKLKKVTAGTMEVNLPMIKIMKKSNMTQESRLQKYFQFEYTLVDCLIFSKFKNS
jgi:RimJ/RimL family protein N-acetyltransferase